MSFLFDCWFFCLWGTGGALWYNTSPRNPIKSGSFHVSPKVVNSLLGSIALLVNCRRSSLVRESFPQSDSSQDEAI